MASREQRHPAGPSAAAPSDEATPLLPSRSDDPPPPPAPRPQRTVTFSPDPIIPAPAPARPLPASGAAPTPHRPPALSTAAPHSAGPTAPAGGPPVLSALNSKLRRRNSHGAPLSAPLAGPSAAAGPPAPPPPPLPKVGPQRTTKTAQKLKLLPNPDPGDGPPDEESGRDVYAQFTRIKDPTARRDAARLGRADRDVLPRVTAYCTANAYRLEGLARYLKGQAASRGAAPKRFDECLYSPFRYPRRKTRGDDEDTNGATGAAVVAEEDGRQEPRNADDSVGPSPPRARRKSDSAIEVEGNTQSRREELLDLSGTGPSAAEDVAPEAHVETQALLQDDRQGDTYETLRDGNGLEAAASAEAAGAMDGDLATRRPHPRHPEIDTDVPTPEVFLFDYGAVVLWGMTAAQERRFLKDVARFETEPLAPDDVQSEDFNFYYTREYQARIYNDFISLRDKRNYMTKLAISHALAQSVKTSLFEDLLATTIALTTPLPAALAARGSIALSRRAIHQRIGRLFVLRIGIHLQGSVLDSPELLWAEPQLEPVYAAVRAYLEMDQRVTLLTERLDVLGDLLAVLKDQARTTHGEALEWIVIVLIAAEILVAATNIFVDLYAGLD